MKLNYLSSDLRITRAGSLAISILLVGLAAACFYHLLCSRATPSRPFPFNTFLFTPAERFSDFSAICGGRSSAEGGNLTPLTIVVGAVGGQLISHAGYRRAYVLFAAGWVALLILALKKLLGEHSSLLVVLLLMLLSYPFIFNIDRGNIAGYVAAFIGLGAAALKKQHYKWASLSFAAAAAIKITPIILGLFFIARRRWLELGLFILFIVGLVLAPALFIRKALLPTYGFGNFQHAMQWYWDVFAMHDAGQGWGSSLWGGIKLVFYWCGKQDILPIMLGLLPYYNGFAAVTLGLMVIPFFCGRGTFEDHVVVVTCWLILMPHVTADYYLLILLVPLALLCAPDQPYRPWAVVLLSLSLIPKSYYWTPMTIASSTAFLNPLFLLVLFTHTLVRILPRINQPHEFQPARSAY